MFGKFTHSSCIYFHWLRDKCLTRSHLHSDVIISTFHNRIPKHSLNARWATDFHSVCNVPKMVIAIAFPLNFYSVDFCCRQQTKSDEKIQKKSKIIETETGTKTQRNDTYQHILIYSVFIINFILFLPLSLFYLAFVKIFFYIQIYSLNHINCLDINKINKKKRMNIMPHNNIEYNQK